MEEMLASRRTAFGQRAHHQDPQPIGKQPD
jgi:hypothetical protein